VLTIAGLSLLLWLAFTRLPAPGHSYSPFQEPEYELVGADSLPDEPSAIMVVNERGKTRWTVSIPRNGSFPLRPAQYREICEQTGEIGRELRRLGGKKEKEKERGYYQRDRYFLDVTEAQRKGLLPRDEEGDDGEGGLPVCEKSMTYVMEMEDARMGNTLLGMWIAYGLALKEGRAFFVDDTRWCVPDFHFRVLPSLLSTLYQFELTVRQLGPTATTPPTSLLHPNHPAHPHHLTIASPVPIPQDTSS
jgi:hypothetical protein